MTSRDLKLPNSKHKKISTNKFYKILQIEIINKTSSMVRQYKIIIKKWLRK